MLFYPVLRIYMISYFLLLIAIKYKNWSLLHVYVVDFGEFQNLHNFLKRNTARLIIFARAWMYYPNTTSNSINMPFRGQCYFFNKVLLHLFENRSKLIKHLQQKNVSAAGATRRQQRTMTTVKRKSGLNKHQW